MEKSKNSAQRSVKRVAVLGAGSWGTALAHHLSRAGHDVALWGRDVEVLKAIHETKRNPRYLVETPLSSSLRTESDLAQVLKQSEVVVIAVPAEGVRGLAREVYQTAVSSLVVSTSKGLEDSSLKRMSEVLAEELQGKSRIAVLSGPTFAIEVAQGKPTAVTAAASDAATAEEAAGIFHFDNLRVYSSTDLVGVELGGVVKNIIAIAAGLVDGLEAGANARAALITRGLFEMQGLVAALGGDPLTVAGLSGLGDLLLTATGDLSRNRRVGMQLAKGDPLEKILQDLGQVAEGVRSTEHVLQLAQQLRIKMPITEEVARILRGERTPQESVNALLSRTRGSEARSRQGAV